MLRLTRDPVKEGEVGASNSHFEFEVVGWLVGRGWRRAVV
jgi:hypothetical protein